MWNELPWESYFCPLCHFDLCLAGETGTGQIIHSASFTSASHAVSLNKEEFVACRPACPGSPQPDWVTFRTILGYHHAASLPHSAPGQRLGFTGSTGPWAAPLLTFIQASLASAPLSAPCYAPTLPQSPGVQNDEGCSLCDLFTSLTLSVFFSIIKAFQLVIRDFPWIC